ncbi:hypothetical protein L7F22_038125 [Adiantum nelumboides]|nr:hypothetical protein [Adiantum nelumboides]
MRKLVGMQLDESKSAAEHLSLFTSILSQLQDSSLPPFYDKMKAIFLLMTLHDSWETLVVSLSNNPNLTFDGVRGSILNEEIRRKQVEKEAAQPTWLEAGHRRRMLMHKGVRVRVRKGKMPAKAKMM